MYSLNQFCKTLPSSTSYLKIIIGTAQNRGRGFTFVEATYRGFKDGRGLHSPFDAGADGVRSRFHLFTLCAIDRDGLIIVRHQRLIDLLVDTSIV